MLTERARYLGKKTFGPAVRVGTAGVLLFSSISCSESKSPLQTDSSSPANSQRQATELEFPFTSGDLRLANGPHPALAGGAVLNSLDFNPQEIIQCSPGDGDEVKYEDNWITSPVSGEVSLVGDENKPDDPSHSIVEIKMRKDPKAEVMLVHLTDIQVEKGDVVEIGEPLGHASCAHTPEELSTGVHVHQGFYYDGQPVDIRHAKIAIAGEWEIKGKGVRNEDGFYDGTLENIRDGRKVIADGRVCGPDDITAMVNCGEKDGQLTNNFIPQDALLNYEGGDEEIPQETQTEEATDEYVEFQSENFNYESEVPDNWKKREGPFLGGKAEYFELGQSYIAVSRQPNDEPYDLEALEFRIQASIEIARPDENYVFPESNDYEIDGEEAKYIRGVIDNKGERLSVSEVVFIKDGNYWIIAFLSPSDEYNEVFENFLKKFSTS